MLAGAWLATHWLLRESAVWRDRNTDEVRARAARRRLRLPPRRRSAGQQGAAAVRPRRLDDRPLRRAPHAPARAAVRRRRGCASGRCVWSLLLVARRQRRSCSGRSASAAVDGALDLGEVVVFAQSAVGASMIAFGGLSWALDGAAAPVAAVLRLEPAMAPAGALRVGRRGRRRACRRARSASATSRSPTRAARRCSTASTSRSPPARRSRSSARTAPARPRSPSCSAGSTTRSPARSRSTASTSASSISTSWRSRVTAVFQDFIRFELPLRDNVAPAGAPDEVVQRGARVGRRARISPSSTRCWPAATTAAPTSPAASGSASRSRARCAPCSSGAGVVLLDEPTAQLDVRGEAEIFDRILAATRHCTTILISHRFSTVRHADRICVLEHGRVVELGTHDELMALGGRYRTMFDLQAQRFAAGEDEEEGASYDVLV